MAKLYFHYSTMNAGKSTLLLQAAYNYQERGMQTFLITAQVDERAGAATISSRIGISQQAANGRILTEGDQVQIGGNETYVSLCRRHWRAAVGPAQT